MTRAVGKEPAALRRARHAVTVASQVAVPRPAAPEPEERHDMLCGCGWGRLAMPESEIPYACPVCGHVFVPEENDE